MIIRSVGLIDWMKLARRKATGLQEYVVGPEAWNCNMALRKAVVGQLLPLGGHWHHWIAIEDQRLVGLIIARDRTSPHIWQVSHLLLSNEAIDLAPEFFHQITAGAYRHSIEKLFLRLPLDSPLKHIALDQGFEPYLVERLYQRPESQGNLRSPSRGISGPWRTKTKQDNWSIFQLYSAVTPATVKQAEGLAYAEWLLARERKNGSYEKVWEKDGQIRGWARVRPWCNGVLFEFLFYPGDEAAFIPLIQTVVRGRQTIYSLTYSYQTQIQTLLGDEGFSTLAEHALFLKRLLVRVTQTHLAPMRV